MRATCVLILVLALGVVGAWGCGERQRPERQAASPSTTQQEVNKAEPEPDVKSQSNGVSCLDIDAPPITLPDLQGEEVILREVLQERYVLLVFWATWCGFCEKEIPALNELHQKYSDTLEILAINYRESKGKVQPYAEEQGITYRVLLDKDATVFRRYGITGTPTLMLVRLDGTICWRGHNPANAEAKLQELLQKN